MARKTKYTEERAQRIIQAVEVGATYRLAAAYAGITDDTLTNWRKRYSDFSERLVAAEGRAGIRWLSRIEEAAKDDWRAAAWKLERRHPEEYGKSVQQLEGSVEQRVTVLRVHDAKAVGDGR
jgi:transposase